MKTDVSNHLNHLNPNFEFLFTLFNGTVFPVRVEMAIQGRLICSGAQFRSSPEILGESNLVLPHGTTAVFRVKQFLQRHEVEFIKRHPTVEPPEFDFSEIRIEACRADRSEATRHCLELGKL